MIPMLDTIVVYMLRFSWKVLQLQIPSQNQYFNKPEFHGTVDNHLCANCVQKLFVIPHNQTLK